MGKKNNIIKNFDNFKNLNEDQSLLSFLSGQVSSTMEESLKEQITKYVLDYFGIAEEVQPGTVAYYIKDIFIAVIGQMSFKEMDAILLGRQSIDDGEYWAEKLAKATTHVLSKNVATNQIVTAMGLDPEAIVGIISHAIDHIIRDEKEIERLIKAAWNVLYKKQFIPDVDSGELYKQAFNALPADQQAKVKGNSLWGSSVRQADTLRSGRS